ncbi:hypothetical protein ACM66B_000857 [Microbotryomycetes sp. NB124-2]
MQGGSEEENSSSLPSVRPRYERESSTHSSTTAAVESAHWTARHRLQDEPSNDTWSTSVAAPIARARPTAATTASRSGSTSASSTTPDELDQVQSSRLDSRARTASPASSLHEGPRPFINALWSMLSNPTLTDAIAWHDDETIVLRHNSTLTERALPVFYGHNNIPSFTRQLNVYGFTRLPVSQTRALLGSASATPASSTDTAQVSAWRHPKFNRRDPSRSSEIVPRLSKEKIARRQMRAAAAAAGGAAGGGGTSVSIPSTPGQQDVDVDEENESEVEEPMNVAHETQN